MTDSIFEDVNAAMDYLLSQERVELSYDERRFHAPFIISEPISRYLGNPFSCYFNDAPDDKFVMTVLRSGRYSLKPNLRNRKYLFRGQSAYYEKCVPNLFRGEKDYFLDDFVYDQELYILILSHPLCQLLDLGFYVGGRPFRFEVNLYGLAQHYYNRTSLLDFTADPEAAKFFAVTDYNKENDSYSPVVSEGSIGCIYYYDLNARDDFSEDHKTGMPRLSTIGLQVFPRSERQRGFLLNVAKGENLNDVERFPKVHCVKFYQHASVSQDIVARANGGAYYFPDDILQHHWKHYNKEQNRVSLQAVRWNVLLNPEESINSIKTKLDKKYQISVRNYQPEFTPDELAVYYEQVRNGLWEQFVNKIFIPSDKNGHYREAFLKIPIREDFRWAFYPNVPHQIEYNKGFLLKRYERFLHQ